MRVSIVPRKTTLAKLLAKKGKVTVVWKKNKFVEGYQIQACKNKKFKDVKDVYVKNYKTTRKNIKLKKGLYYIRIRGYRQLKGEKIFSKWSKILKVKVK